MLLFRSSHAFYAIVSWKNNHVTTWPPQLPDMTHKSSRVVAQPVCSILRGNRDELHVSGSTLTFAMARDAEPLAHRRFAGSARGVSNRSAFKLPIRFETNLVLLVLHHRRSERRSA